MALYFYENYNSKSLIICYQGAHNHRAHLHCLVGFSFFFFLFFEDKSLMVNI